MTLPELRAALEGMTARLRYSRDLRHSREDRNVAELDVLVAAPDVLAAASDLLRLAEAAVAREAAREIWDTTPEGPDEPAAFEAHNAALDEYAAALEPFLSPQPEEEKP